MCVLCHSRVYHGLERVCMYARTNTTGIWGQRPRSSVIGLFCVFVPCIHLEQQRARKEMLSGLVSFRPEAKKKIKRKLTGEVCFLKEENNLS